MCVCRVLEGKQGTRKNIRKIKTHTQRGRQTERERERERCVLNQLTKIDK